MARNLFEALARAIGLYLAISGLIRLVVLVASDSWVGEVLLSSGLTFVVGAALLFKADLVSEQVFGASGGRER